jgi:hypothetical protein
VERESARFLFSSLQAFAHLASRREQNATGRAMQYKGFDIRAFEQEPGKWRARIVRANGKPLKASSRNLRELETSVDLSSAVDAMISAMQTVDGLTLNMEATDVGFIFHNTKRKAERHWRVLLRTNEISGRHHA